MVELESGELVPVAFWHSNDFLNNSLAADKRITSFEAGKRYMYSLDIRTKDGFTFANKDNIVNVNGKRVNSSNADKTPAGLFVVRIQINRINLVNQSNQVNQQMVPRINQVVQVQKQKRIRIKQLLSFKQVRQKLQLLKRQKQKRKILFKPVKLLTWFNGYL